MGTILLRAMVKANIAKHIIVCEINKDRQRSLRRVSKLVQITNHATDCQEADIIFMAVKPQDFSTITLQVSSPTIVCSIMAGVSIATIKKQLGNNPVVRMMPNMPAKSGEGFTVWTATKNVTTTHKRVIKKILSYMGEEMFVTTEDTIDKATAVSGSGPAYFFYTIHVFIQAAKKLGFSKDEATLMVIQTLKGASALIDKKSDVKTLVSHVASKGGTTEAALNVFTKEKMDSIWEQAIKAAYERAKELSKS